MDLRRMHLFFLQVVDVVHRWRLFFKTWNTTFGHGIHYIILWESTGRRCWEGLVGCSFIFKPYALSRFLKNTLKTRGHKKVRIQNFVWQGCALSHFYLPEFHLSHDCLLSLVYPLSLHTASWLVIYAYMYSIYIHYDVSISDIYVYVCMCQRQCECVYVYIYTDSSPGWVIVRAWPLDVLYIWLGLGK